MIDPHPLYILDVAHGVDYPIAKEHADASQARRLAMLLLEAAAAGLPYATIAHVLATRAGIAASYTPREHHARPYLDKGRALLARVLDQHLATLTDRDRTAIMADCDVLLHSDEPQASPAGLIGAICSHHARHIASAEPTPKRLTYDV